MRSSLKSAARWVWDPGKPPATALEASWRASKAIVLPFVGVGLIRAALAAAHEGQRVTALFAAAAGVATLALVLVRPRRAVMDVVRLLQARPGTGE